MRAVFVDANETLAAVARRYTWRLVTPEVPSVGVSTLVPIATRSVRAASAPSQGSAAGACPPSCRHGCRWSLTNTESKPSCSACTP